MMSNRFESLGQEQDTVEWRPRLHFTPQKNWINDPNGLVYFEGEYHIFYQYNPQGKDWGHMSWGHAVSRDLLTWQELPVAIPERAYMIFSGSVVVDWRNTSGLSDSGGPVMVACFTAHFMQFDRQSQYIAFSNDRGRTWEMYRGNPVIDLNLAHHRDPFVFWHADSNCWIMVVALPRAHQVEIYRSENLLCWTLASRFGPHGAVGGQWECPVLIAVPAEGSGGELRWVLKVDVDADLISKGSGAQYFVGSFDGFVFSADSDDCGPIARVADHGRDFYAATPWANLPESHGFPIWLAWMSNHQTGKDYPTHPWRGALTIPRELFVFEHEGRWLLGQRPIPVPRSLAVDVYFDADDSDYQSGKVIAKFAAGDTRYFSFRISAGGQHHLALSLFCGEGRPEFAIKFNPSNGLVSVVDGNGVVRSAARCGDISAADLSVDVFVDASCIEVFVDHGRLAFAQCWFPQGEYEVSARSCARIE
jgi:levanase/fructan beta-fructosidase